MCIRGKAKVWVSAHRLLDRIRVNILRLHNIGVYGISETCLHVYPLDGHFINIIHTDYTGINASAFGYKMNDINNRNVRKGRVALLWKSSMNSNIQVLDIADGRIVRICLQYEANTCYFICQIYCLPSSNHCYDGMDCSG